MRAHPPLHRPRGGALLKLLGIVSLLAGAALAAFLYQSRPQWFGAGLSEDEHPAASQPAPPPPAPEPPRLPPPADSKALTEAVLASSTRLFDEMMARADMRYRKPEVMLVQGAHDSPCELKLKAVGSHFCPGNRTLYLDLAQLGELQAAGSDAGYLGQSYLIVHLLGNHLGNQAGIDSRFALAYEETGRKNLDELRTRRALLNDCLAGIWLRYARKELSWLEPAAIGEAMTLVNARNHALAQRLASAERLPAPFDHGTSSQREFALRLGYDNGDPASCDPLIRAR